MLLLNGPSTVKKFLRSNKQCSSFRVFKYSGDAEFEYESGKVSATPKRSLQVWDRSVQLLCYPSCSDTLTLKYISTIKL